MSEFRRKPVDVAPRSRGFTLIEMLLVLVVLAIVASLTIGTFGWVRRSANYAASSNTQGALMSNMEMYRVTFGNNSYPDRMDSLLVNDAGTYTPPTYFTSGLANLIVPTICDADQWASINNSGRGLRTVMDHTATYTAAIEGNPGNAATVARNFNGAAAGSADRTLAFVNTATTNTEGQQLLRALGYVNETTGIPELPAGVSLVLLGVGPSNTALGKTLQTPPFDTNVDPSKEYNRFVGVFAVYSPREGRRAQLKAILCPRGRILNRNLSEYHQSTNPD
jgi:prepilin-type N-terminal cleavage/methylation domain-containing protein